MTYTGHLYDPETGLFYFGARYYDPETGRFLTHDPVAGDALNPPSLHKYLYAYSSPMTFTDPWGEDAWTKDFNETGREYEREHRKFSVTVSQNQNVEGVQKSRVYIEPESHDINLYGYSGGNTQVYRIPKGYAQDHPVAAYEMLTSAGQLTPKQALDALSFVGVQIAFGSPAYRKIFCQAANTYSIAYGKHVTRQWIENMAGMAVGEIVGPVAGRLVGAAGRALARTEGDAVAQTLIKSEDELGTMTGREFIPRSATTEAGARKALTDQAYPELQHFGVKVPPEIATDETLGMTERGGSVGAAKADESIPKPKLRIEYETEVKRLKTLREKMIKAGWSVEERAKVLSGLRRELGIKYKNMTPPDILEEIYRANRQDYGGDPLGPTVEYLRSHEKTWEQIEEGALKVGPWPPKRWVFKVKG